jgi:hypothetical protein
MEFNFTKIGFLRFKRWKVESFLRTLKASLPKESAIGSGIGPIPAAADPWLCEVCGGNDVSVFTFYVLRFVGIVPFAYAYRLTPLRFVLCSGHARKQAIICCMRTAVTGYLGFPGFLAAPWYVMRNLWALRRARVGNFGSTIVGLACIMLPWAAIAILIVFLMNVFGK